ncbi:MAG TPA: phosphate ABC transporter substrate-binding protein [Bacillota bacterium]
MSKGLLIQMLFSDRIRWAGRAAAASAIVALAITLLIAGAGCRRTPRVGASITAAGSTSVQPFAEFLAESYMAGGGAPPINVQGGGSSAGIQAAIEGAAQIGMSSRDLKPDEKAVLKEYIIAHDAIAIIVNPQNPVEALTKAQVRAVFSGTVTNWKQFGGPDRAITVISREEGSGTRSSFDEGVLKEVALTPSALVQDSNGSVRETVAGDRNAIGYLSLGLVDSRVKAVSLDGVQPTLQTARSKQYPLVRPFLFLTKGDPPEGVRRFLDYVLGSEGQTILLKEGLVPANPAIGG